MSILNQGIRILYSSGINAFYSWHRELSEDELAEFHVEKQALIDSWDTIMSAGGDAILPAEKQLMTVWGVCNRKYQKMRNEALKAGDNALDN